MMLKICKSLTLNNFVPRAFVALGSLAVFIESFSGARATERPIYAFDGSTGASGGYFPEGRLTFGPGNALYGTAEAGGGGGGVVFKLTPPSSGTGSWTETILYTFTQAFNSPSTAVVFDAAGNLYGRVNVIGNSFGPGGVFKLTPPASGTGPWKASLLHAFGKGADGNMSYYTSDLSIDKNGVLYGVTFIGGRLNHGIVFALTPPAGPGPAKETILHSFTGQKDGAIPQSGLLMDSTGALYGTASSGGIEGSGVVFKLTPPASGTGPWKFSVVYDFGRADGAVGASPVGTLVMDANGALYGTASSGGAANDGTVFKLTPPTGTGPWTGTALYSFQGRDGNGPQGAIAFDARGALYGTTIAGGPYGYGVVFKLAPPASGTGPWTRTILHSFSGKTDGSYPATGLTIDAASSVYGTAFGAGSGTGCGQDGCGVAFTAK